MLYLDFTIRCGYFSIETKISWNIKLLDKFARTAKYTVAAYQLH